VPNGVGRHVLVVVLDELQMATEPLAEVSLPLVVVGATTPDDTLVIVDVAEPL
jgi:hypothetical protein